MAIISAFATNWGSVHTTSVTVVWDVDGPMSWAKSLVSTLDAVALEVLVLDLTKVFNTFWLSVHFGLSASSTFSLSLTFWSVDKKPLLGTPNS